MSQLNELKIWDKTFMTIEKLICCMKTFKTEYFMTTNFKVLLIIKLFCNIR